jgi:ribosome-binding factor A
MDEIRHKKLEEQLQEELSSLILSGEVKDPRVGPFTSITRVEASRDLSTAKVYVSAFGVTSDALAGPEKDSKQNEAELARIDEAVAGLTSAAGFIQSHVAKRVRLRVTPRLTFVADHGIKEGFELNERIKGLFQ